MRNVPNVRINVSNAVLGSGVISVVTVARVRFTSVVRLLGNGVTSLSLWLPGR